MSDETTTPYRRVLLKLSGEAFGGGKVGVAPDVVRGIAEQIAAAFSLCRENELPMVVFGMEGEGNVTRALLGESIGTVVHA